MTIYGYRALPNSIKKKKIVEHITAVREVLVLSQVAFVDVSLESFHALVCVGDSNSNEIRPSTLIFYPTLTLVVCYMMAFPVYTSTLEYN